MGRPKAAINPAFAERVVELRKETDYGSDKIHFVLEGQGYRVSKRQIQHILDERGLTEPCRKRRGQRKYIQFQWPFSNFMWHTDWSFFDKMWHITYVDDRSRRIMAAARFARATEENAVFVLYQAILANESCPAVILSDKGAQFYANKRTRKGKRSISMFEKKLGELGIELWTSRRRHPQTNGKQEKLFDTMQKWLGKRPDKALRDFVEFYNKKRIHHALDYKTPEEAYWENL